MVLNPCVVRHKRENDLIVADALELQESFAFISNLCDEWLCEGNSVRVVGKAGYCSALCNFICCKSHDHELPSLGCSDSGRHVLSLCMKWSQMAQSTVCDQVTSHAGDYVLAGSAVSALRSISASIKVASCLSGLTKAGPVGGTSHMTAVADRSASCVMWTLVQTPDENQASTLVSAMLWGGRDRWQSLRLQQEHSSDEPSPNILPSAAARLSSIPACSHTVGISMSSVSGMGSLLGVRVLSAGIVEACEYRSTAAISAGASVRELAAIADSNDLYDYCSLDYQVTRWRRSRDVFADAEARLQELERAGAMRDSVPDGERMGGDGGQGGDEPPPPLPPVAPTEWSAGALGHFATASCSYPSTGSVRHASEGRSQGPPDGSIVLFVGGSALSPSPSEVSSGRVAALSMVTVLRSFDASPRGPKVGAEAADSPDRGVSDGAHGPIVQPVAGVSFSAGMLSHAERAVKVVPLRESIGRASDSMGGSSAGAAGDSSKGSGRPGIGTWEEVRGETLRASAEDLSEGEGVGDFEPDVGRKGTAGTGAGAAVPLRMTCSEDGRQLAVLSLAGLSLWHIMRHVDEGHHGAHEDPELELVGHVSQMSLQQLSGSSVEAYRGTMAWIESRCFWLPADSNATTSSGRVYGVLVGSALYPGLTAASEAGESDREFQLEATAVALDVGPLSDQDAVSDRPHCVSTSPWLVGAGPFGSDTAKLVQMGSGHVCTASLGMVSRLEIAKMQLEQGNSAAAMEAIRDHLQRHSNGRVSWKGVWVTALGWGSTRAQFPSSMGAVATAVLQACYDTETIQEAASAMLQLAPSSEREATDVATIVADLASTWPDLEQSALIKLARRHLRILAMYRRLRSAEKIAQQIGAGSSPRPISSHGGASAFASFKPGLYVKMRQERLPVIAGVIASQGATRALLSLLKSQPKALAPHLLSILSYIPPGLPLDSYDFLLPIPSPEGDESHDGSASVWLLGFGQDGSGSAAGTVEGGYIKLQWSEPADAAGGGGSNSSPRDAGNGSAPVELGVILSSVRAADQQGSFQLAELLYAQSSPQLLAEWYLHRAIAIDAGGGSLLDSCAILSIGSRCLGGDSLPGIRLNEALKHAARLHTFAFELDVCQQTSLRDWIESDADSKCSLALRGVSIHSARAVLKTRMLPLLSAGSRSFGRQKILVQGEEINLGDVAVDSDSGRKEADAAEMRRALLGHFASRLRDEVRVLAEDAGATSLAAPGQGVPSSPSKFHSGRLGETSDQLWQLETLAIVNSVANSREPLDCVPSVAFAMQLCLVLAQEALAIHQGVRGIPASFRQVLVQEASRLLEDSPSGLVVGAASSSSVQVPTLPAGSRAMIASLEAASRSQLRALREQMLDRIRTVQTMDRYGLGGETELQMAGAHEARAMLHEVRDAVLVVPRAGRHGSLFDLMVAAVPAVKISYKGDIPCEVRYRIVSQVLNGIDPGASVPRLLEAALDAALLLVTVTSVQSEHHGPAVEPALVKCWVVQQVTRTLCLQGRLAEAASFAAAAAAAPSMPAEASRHAAQGAVTAAVDLLVAREGIIAAGKLHSSLHTGCITAGLRASVRSSQACEIALDALSEEPSFAVAIAAESVRNIARFCVLETLLGRMDASLRSVKCGAFGVRSICMSHAQRWCAAGAVPKWNRIDWGSDGLPRLSRAGSIPLDREGFSSIDKQDHDQQSSPDEALAAAVDLAEYSLSIASGVQANPHKSVVASAIAQEQEQDEGIRAISSVATTIGSAVSRRIQGAAVEFSRRLGGGTGEGGEDSSSGYLPGAGIRSLVGDLLGTVSKGGQQLSSAMHLDSVGSMVAGAGNMALAAAQQALLADGTAEISVAETARASAGSQLMARIYRERGEASDDAPAAWAQIEMRRSSATESPLEPSLKVLESLAKLLASSQFDQGDRTSNGRCQRWVKLARGTGQQVLGMQSDVKVEDEHYSSLVELEERRARLTFDELPGATDDLSTFASSWRAATHRLSLDAQPEEILAWGQQLLQPALGDPDDAMHGYTAHSLYLARRSAIEQLKALQTCAEGREGSSTDESREQLAGVVWALAVSDPGTAGALAAQLERPVEWMKTYMSALLILYVRCSIASRQARTPELLRSNGLSYAGPTGQEDDEDAEGRLNSAMQAIVGLATLQQVVVQLLQSMYRFVTSVTGQVKGSFDSEDINAQKSSAGKSPGSDVGFIEQKGCPLSEYEGSWAAAAQSVVAMLRDDAAIGLCDGHRNDETIVFGQQSHQASSARKEGADETFTAPSAAGVGNVVEDDLRDALEFMEANRVSLEHLLSVACIFSVEGTADGSRRAGSAADRAIVSAFVVSHKESGEEEIADSPHVGPAAAADNTTNHAQGPGENRDATVRIACRAALVSCGLLLEEAATADRPGIPLVARGGGQLGDKEKSALLASSRAVTTGEGESQQAIRAMLVARAFICCCCTIEGSVFSPSVRSAARSVLTAVLPEGVRERLVGALSTRPPAHASDSMEESRLVHALRACVGRMDSSQTIVVLRAASMCAAACSSTEFSCAMLAACAPELNLNSSAIEAATAWCLALTGQQGRWTKEAKAGEGLRLVACLGGWNTVQLLRVTEGDPATKEAIAAVIGPIKEAGGPNSATNLRQGARFTILKALRGSAVAIAGGLSKKYAALSFALSGVEASDMDERKKHIKLAQRAILEGWVMAGCSQWWSGGDSDDPGPVAQAVAPAASKLITTRRLPMEALPRIALSCGLLPPSPELLRLAGVPVDSAATSRNSWFAAGVAIESIQGFEATPRWARAVKEVQAALRSAACSVLGRSPTADSAEKRPQLYAAYIAATLQLQVLACHEACVQEGNGMQASRLPQVLAIAVELQIRSNKCRLRPKDSAAPSEVAFAAAEQADLLSLIEPSALAKACQFAGLSSPEAIILLESIGVKPESAQVAVAETLPRLGLAVLRRAMDSLQADEGMLLHSEEAARAVGSKAEADSIAPASGAGAREGDLGLDEALRLLAGPAGSKPPSAELVRNSLLWVQKPAADTAESAEVALVESSWLQKEAARACEDMLKRVATTDGEPAAALRRQLLAAIESLAPPDSPIGRESDGIAGGDGVVAAAKAQDRARQALGDVGLKLPEAVLARLVGSTSPLEGPGAGDERFLAAFSQGLQATGSDSTAPWMALAARAGLWLSLSSGPWSASLDRLRSVATAGAGTTEGQMELALLLLEPMGSGAVASASRMGCADITLPCGIDGSEIYGQTQGDLLRRLIALVAEIASMDADRLSAEDFGLAAAARVVSEAVLALEAGTFGDAMDGANDARQSTSLLALNALAMARKGGGEGLPVTSMVLAGLVLSLALEGGRGEVPSDVRRQVDDALFDSASAASEAVEVDKGSSLRSCVLAAAAVQTAGLVGVGALSEISPASMQSVLKIVPVVAGGWAASEERRMAGAAVSCGLLLCEMVLSGSVDSASDAAFLPRDPAAGGEGGSDGDPYSTGASRYDRVRGMIRWLLAAQEEGIPAESPWCSKWARAAVHATVNRCGMLAMQKVDAARAGVLEAERASEERAAAAQAALEAARQGSTGMISWLSSSVQAAAESAFGGAGAGAGDQTVGGSRGAERGEGGVGVGAKGIGSPATSVGGYAGRAADGGAGNEGAAVGGVVSSAAGGEGASPRGGAGEDDAGDGWDDDWGAEDGQSTGGSSPDRSATAGGKFAPPGAGAVQSVAAGDGGGSGGSKPESAKVDPDLNFDDDDW